MNNDEAIPLHKWYKFFNIDERQQKEIEFAEIYDHGFHHGTDGHNRLLLIAKLADALDRLYKDGE